MSNLATIASLPQVKRAVLSDRSGALLDALREPDGEAVAAVSAFLSTALADAGDALGLGTLHSVAFGGPSRAWLLFPRSASVVTAVIEPASALAAVAQHIETSLAEHG